MSEPRDSAAPSWWPAEPQPFIWYRPPREQPVRAGTPREAWELTQRFLERATLPYGESKRSLVVSAERWLPGSEAIEGWPEVERPSECAPEAFAAAVRLAEERFGTPMRRLVGEEAREHDVEEQHMWLVPIERVDDVLGYLALVPDCTRGRWAPVGASFSTMFLLRDLSTGGPLPGQGPRHHLAIPSIFLLLAERSTTALGLTLPFAEAGPAAADYVVALQEHLPVWLDPRYFDVMTPVPGEHRYHRVRLPSSWLGTTSDGRPGLDASRSGVTPRTVSLPSEEEMAAEGDPNDGYEPFHAAVAAVEQALRDNRAAAIVLEASIDANPRFLVEQAAARAELPMGVLERVRPANARTRADELREDLPELAGAPGVLLVEPALVARRPSLADVVAAAAGRVVEGVPIPDEVRLVLLVEAPRQRGRDAASDRAAIARVEGFGTPEQHAFLARQASREANNAIKVILVPRGSGATE